MTRLKPALPRGARRKVALVAAGAATYYRECGRHFPWRDERDPYRLAVAEIALQKTRASCALPVYEALLSRYPSAAQMTAADESELEAMLQPIGLSRKRAAQLRAMAGDAMREGPQIFADWRRVLADIPGLGTYAARAIACFGRGERLGIVDANIARIFRRVFCISANDPRAVVYQRLADAVAHTAVDARETNFGLLDVGAAVCLVKPRCVACPFDAICPKYGGIYETRL